jgi:hypothetical protein
MMKKNVFGSVLLGHDRCTTWEHPGHQECETVGMLLVGLTYSCSTSYHHYGALAIPVQVCVGLQCCLHTHFSVSKVDIVSPWNKVKFLLWTIFQYYALCMKGNHRLSCSEELGTYSAATNHFVVGKTTHSRPQTKTNASPIFGLSTCQCFQI